MRFLGRVLIASAVSVVVRKLIKKYQRTDTSKSDRTASAS